MPSSDPSADRSQVGAVPRVSDHELLRCIGVGAAGEVWLARSITGTLRAVKVVRRERFEHERTYEREFAGLKRFEPISRHHEGVVDVLQIGRDDAAGYFYYLMELADDATGEGAAERYVPLTLAEHLRRNGRVPVRECARTGAAVAEALAFLHSNGLVHRDVKPSNIVFVGGRPKLADIGLVTGLGEARSFVGTDGYIPPEGPGTPAADLFSLGRVLYEMLTGRSRYEYPELPDDLSVGEGGDFAELNEIVLKACAGEPEGRHVSAEDLRGELLLVDAGRSVRRLRRNERLLGLWRRIGLAALVASVVGGGAWWVQQEETRTARRLAGAETRQRQELEQREMKARLNLYAADMNLAQQALEGGNYGRAEALLSASRPGAGQADLRGIEWYHFSHRARGDSTGVLRGHEQVISALEWDATGERLYSASFDTTIREWSVSERRETRRWNLPEGLFMTMAFDPERRRLACEGGNRPMTAILSLADGQWTHRRLTASPSVAWLPEGKGLLRGASMFLFETNGVLEALDENLEPRGRWAETGGRLAFQPGNRVLATGPWGRQIRFWRWPDMERIGTAEDVGTAMCMTFSPDGTRLISGSRDGRLRLSEVPSGRRVAERVAHGGAVIWSAVFSPDGRRIATGGNDQTVMTWDAATLEPLHVYRGHGNEVWAVSWSPDGRHLVSAGKDATIRFWDPAPPAGPPEVADVAQAPVFSPDERLVVIRTRREGCQVRETASGRLVWSAPSAQEVGGFGMEGGRISILVEGGRIEWRQAEDGTVLESRVVEVTGDPSYRRALSADGRWLAFGMNSGLVRVCDARGDGKPFDLVGHSGMVVSLAMHPEGAGLLTGSMDRSARLWDLRQRRCVRVFEGHRMAVGTVAFAAASADYRIATGGWDDTLVLWDGETGRQLAVLGGHENGVQGTAFAPDGRTVISLSGASQLRFWSIAAEREAGVESLSRGTRQGWVSVSPRGSWVAAVSQSGILNLLHAPH